MAQHPISDAWFHRVKSATRDLVKACGGVVRAGELAHASKSEVSRWQSPADSDLISIPAALALEGECGLPLVTTAMADLHGRRLSDPDAEGAVVANVFTRHAEAMRAAAELMAAGAKAAEDGRLTGAEAEIMDRAASAAELSIAQLRRDLAGAKTLKVVGG